MFSGLLFILFVKLLVFVCKAEILVTFLFIHTIKLTLTVSKLHPFFFFVGFYLACNLKN